MDLADAQGTFLRQIASGPELSLQNTKMLEYYVGRLENLESHFVCQEIR